MRTRFSNSSRNAFTTGQKEGKNWIAGCSIFSCKCGTFTSRKVDLPFHSPTTRHTRVSYCLCVYTALHNTNSIFRKKTSYAVLWFHINATSLDPLEWSSALIDRSMHRPKSELDHSRGGISIFTSRVLSIPRKASTATTCRAYHITTMQPMILASKALSLLPLESPTRFFRWTDFSRAVTAFSDIKMSEPDLLINSPPDQHFSAPCNCTLERCNLANNAAHILSPKERNSLYRFLVARNLFSWKLKSMTMLTTCNMSFLGRRGATKDKQTHSICMRSQTVWCAPGQADYCRKYDKKVCLSWRTVQLYGARRGRFFLFMFCTGQRDCGWLFTAGLTNLGVSRKNA